MLLKNSSTGKEYAGNAPVSDWCRQIVNDINRRITSLEIPRYKHIVQIMLSEQTGAGCRYVSLKKISESFEIRECFEIQNSVHSFQIHCSLPLGRKL